MTVKNNYLTSYVLDPPHGGTCCFLDRDNNIQVIICLVQKAV
jgi:hypothetical protein